VTFRGARWGGTALRPHHLPDGFVVSYVDSETGYGAPTVAPALRIDLAATIKWDRAASHVAAFAANCIASAALIRWAAVFIRRCCS
jgi:hypothetical protein